MKKVLALAILLAFAATSALAQTEAKSPLENAKIFAKIGDWENGIKYLEPHILQNPTDAEARFLLAECYFNWPDPKDGQDRNQDRAKAQIRILGNLGESGVQMLLRGLHSKTPDVSWLCAEALTDTKDPRAVPELIQLVREDPEGGASHAMLLLTQTEAARAQLDQSFVDLVLSLLETQATPPWVRVCGAQAVAQLKMQQALPVVKKEFERLTALLPSVDLSKDRADLALQELTFLVDALLTMSKENPEAQLRTTLLAIDRKQLRTIYGWIDPSTWRELSPDTFALFTRLALEMIADDPGLIWVPGRPDQAGIERFLDRIAKGLPDVLLRPDVRPKLYKLCDSQRLEVRTEIYRILGQIRDENALDIVLPRLEPFRPQSGNNLYDWANEESNEIWNAVERIASPKTTALLLEKLNSDDLAWVVMAAHRLSKIGALDAAEAIKTSYSELYSELSAAPTLEHDQLALLWSLAESYQRLTGKSIARPIRVAPEKGR